MILAAPEPMELGALIPLACEPGCLPAKTSYAMSILLFLSSTGFKLAVILASFQNQSVCSSMNLEGTIQNVFVGVTALHLAHSSVACVRYPVYNTVIVVMTVSSKCWPLEKQNN